MWIGDIDVPQAVLDAAAAGTLVLFIGAGASRGHPSDLPDFAQLVRNIGTLVGRDPTDDEVRHPDVFLGRLQDNGNDVHQLVSNAIDLPGSQPNALHHAIASLAAAYPIPRIVTTNYDGHLTLAASALALVVDVYRAPALPVGDDFEGIVHLHGSLSQPSRRLVVTDSDFGRAYLREAWAARFLERMFSTFTVAFIGYSHGDVVMQYVARSLGPSRKRYVFTDDEHNAEWRRLGLTPIWYPTDAGDHSVLPASLERWRDLATMGQVEHRRRLANLLSAEPPTIPEEVSYVEAALAHPVRIRYFVEKPRPEDTGRSERWFGWIEGRPAFLALFSYSSAGESTSRILMTWLADQYILAEEVSGLALRAFRDKLWPPETWYIIAQALFAYNGTFPKWLNSWLQLVLQNAPGRHHDLLDMMLTNNDWSTNFDLAVMVFEDRTRPHIKRAFDFGNATDRPRFEVDLNGDMHWLAESWTKVFVPVLDQHFAELLALTTEQISRVYRSVRSLNSESPFDSISYSRSAIEDHEPGSHGHSIDVLIDAARDSIEAALLNSPPIAEAYLDLWRSSSNTILRRLAVHGWRMHGGISATEKLKWLLKNDLLWDLPLRHEIFQLIRGALPNASEAIARELIDAASAGPPSDADEHSLDRSYDLLGWLASSAPDLRLASEAFEQALSAQPELGRKEIPDLNRYRAIGVLEDALPFTQMEFHEMVEQDLAAALNSVRGFQRQTHTVSGPTWAGALRSLQACVLKFPEDGLKIAQVLEEDDSHLRISIIRGWDGATLADPVVERVLSIISGWDYDEVCRPVASMFSNGGGIEHPTAWHQYESARRLASNLWPSPAVDGAIVIGSDLVTEAINHPAGDLSEFWIKVVQSDWTKNQSTWDGLPTAVVTELDRLVSTADRNGLLARVIFGSQLDFFFSADREWCEDRLLPLFNWTDELEALAVWQGFLMWGRWNDGLLQAGLLESYLATASHADHLPHDLRHQLAEHMASVVMFASTFPASWLTRFVVQTSVDLRLAWAQRVMRNLAQLHVDDVPGQWQRWIQAYWSARNSSVPLPFSSAEASATAGWVLELPGVRSQAIDAVLNSEAGIVGHDRFIYRLTLIDVAVDASDWARLLTHLLKNTSGQLWGSHHLKDIVLRLRQANTPPDLTRLINEAMRLGVTDAADW